MSGWGAYYLGMNYPLRFILFGGILAFSALALEENKTFNHFTQVTLVVGYYTHLLQCGYYQYLEIMILKIIT
ncbi:unknown [Rickettsia conorii str. Malish 7]|uniref:Uncharacterized protein n=1 Tax=Rickettsia conorii (strain ATCC VR-613 / Malish 7) TaxID=272944 RepID=Q92H27_RICCN|nr:unknown [Rickettsia conorii str. Malish 7]